MSKRPTILDPAQSEATTIQWIQSTAIQLPKLSAMALQREAFEHYDKSVAAGAPTAAALAAGIMNLPELDQKTAAARRSEWSRSRCVEFLRTSAAKLNKELVEIAEKTESEAVKVAVIDAIYKAISTEYPHLKTEAADMAVRRKLELARNGRKTSAAVMSQTAEPEPPAVTPEAPKATLAKLSSMPQQTVKRTWCRSVHAQLAALRLVHRYRRSAAAAAEGITIDALQANGLVQNLLIQSYYQRRSH